MTRLDFERPIVDLENKIKELRRVGHSKVNLEPEAKKLEQKLE